VENLLKISDGRRMTDGGKINGQIFSLVPIKFSGLVNSFIQSLDFLLADLKNRFWTVGAGVSCFWP